MKRMISTMQARKMLRKGSRGFLAHVQEVAMNRDGLGLILVVREFLDVFLVVLPPKREIDFGINLVRY